MTNGIFENEQKIKEKLNASGNLDESERALLERLNGRQPTLDICGHTYFVNWMQERLERKGDPTKGIYFTALLDYYSEDLDNICAIPYNKRTREIDESFDHQTITDIPKDVVVVSFPTPETMDPVGYSRTGAWSLESLLEEGPQGRHFVAKQLKGTDSWLEYLVNSNRKARGMPALKPTPPRKGFRK
jgi:hypothetical protein